MAESTPLLVDVDDNNPDINTDNEELDTQTVVPGEQIQIPASTYFKRPVKILTSVIFIASIFTVILLIANYVIVLSIPFFKPSRWYFSQAEDASVGLGIFLLISFICAIINLRVKVPILLNLIVDIVLTLCIFTWVTALASAWPDSQWCGIEYGYPRPGNPDPEPVFPDPRCGDWKLVVRILMGIAAGLGGIVGAIHLALLVLRSIAIFRTKFWKTPLPWSFPTGQITLELSIKVLGKETGGRASAESSISVNRLVEPIARA